MSTTAPTGTKEEQEAAARASYEKMKEEEAEKVSEAATSRSASKVYSTFDSHLQHVNAADTLLPSYCSVCGNFSLICYNGTSLLPRTPERWIVLDTRKVQAQWHCKLSSEPVTVKVSEKSVERRRLLLCEECEAPLGFTCAPEDNVTFIFPSALSFDMLTGEKRIDTMLTQLRNKGVFQRPPMLSEPVAKMSDGTTVKVASVHHDEDGESDSDDAAPMPEFT
ncbi:MAG: hypothetical protein MHM6MM_000803 [Cercozoa sp. M6MM]